MDTKKKEELGDFYRDGKLYTQEELKTYDHDFKSYAEGSVVPHSFYDLKLNIGYVQIGVSHDSSEFACDSFRHWWYTLGSITTRRLQPSSFSVMEAGAIALCTKLNENKRLLESIPGVGKVVAIRMLMVIGSREFNSASQRLPLI